MAATAYDVLIIGSGPGGGTVARRLAQTGKRILLLERGDYLKRERQNWDTNEVFGKGRYQAKETWYARNRARPSSPACIISSAATPSSTAPRCCGCAKAISTTCATRRRLAGMAAEI